MPDQLAKRLGGFRHGSQNYTDLGAQCLNSRFGNDNVLYHSLSETKGKCNILPRQPTGFRAWSLDTNDWSRF